MSSVYRGYDIVHRIGKETVLVIKAEVSSEEVKNLLEGEYHFLFVLDKYKVMLYGCKNHSYVPILDIGSFKGYTVMQNFGEELYLEFEIPVSSRLIESINDVRRKGMTVTLMIEYDYSITRILSPRIVRGSSFVYKITPTGEKTNYMMFSTEEIYDLMRKLKYAEIIRIEIPVSMELIPTQDILKKCVEELKIVRDLLVKGDYPRAIVTCRNIIMNYLTKKIEVEGKKIRILRPELRKFIIAKVSKDYSEIYEKILDAIQETLNRNLDHIHKFVKEDVGKLIRMPLREDVEYVYLMLTAIIRYLSQLILTWGS